MSMIKTITGLLLAAALTACGGGGGSGSGTKTTTTTTTTSVSAAVASILLTAPSPLTLSADGTTSKTLTVRALDASGGLVKGAVVALTTTGSTILSASSVTTDATTGLATVALTANSQDQSSRQALVTASCASCSAAPATLQIGVNGSTLSVSTPGGTSLTVGSGSVTLTATVKDISGSPPAVSVPITFVASDPAVLSLGRSSGSTDGNGNVSTTVSGLKNGTASIVVTAAGTSVTVSFNVLAVVGDLVINSPANNSVMYTGVGGAKQITVSAPGASALNFYSGLTGATFSPPVYTGTPGGSDFGGSSIFTATAAGTAVVQVVDNKSPVRSKSITLIVSPPSADKLQLNASQTTIGLASGTSTPSIRLTVTALSTSGGNSQPVANIPILFSMSGGPAAGEYLTPPFAVTDSSGNATADFYSGTAASIQNGIVVSAQIPGTSVMTGTGSSSASARLTIGGRALSVAIGQSSTIRASADGTLYYLDHSILVSDANNNPVANQLVTLRLSPVAFSLGGNCTVGTDVTSGGPATYCSEDSNQNGSLDSGEDGVRKPTSVGTVGSCSTIVAGPVGTADAQLTPQNSVGGTVPSTVTTDATGTAQFALTYLKAYAIWVVDKLTATVSVNGTESTTSTNFQLPAAVTDGVPGATTCHIPPSPFAY